MIKNHAALLLGLALAGCGAAGAEVAPREYQGVVEFEQVDLGFEFAGRLVGLFVRRGDHVQVGQRLASIDDALERAATRARQGESEAALARAAVTRAGSRPEERRALAARIRAADAQIRQLLENLTRERKLLQAGATPPSVVDDLAAALDRAQADRDALAQNLELLERGPRREELDELDSRARATQALLDAQRERNERFEARAPLAGDVLDTLFEPGEVVPAAVPVVSLADTTRPFAEVFVPQAELGAVRLGERVEVRVDALGEPLGGYIEHVARRTEFTPRYLFSETERSNLVVRVRVRVEDPGRRLHAGVPARVSFPRRAAAAGELARWSPP
jgi:HlyD family secretion protein